MDNTAAPMLVRPFDHGAAVVMYSTTKYIGGHGTSIGGVVIDGGNFPWDQHKERQPLLNTPDPSYHGAVWAEAAKPLGPIAYILRMRVVLLRDLGASMAPFNAFLFLQGLESMPLRMREHSKNTLAVAQYLSSRKEVTRVIHPAFHTGVAAERTAKYLPHGHGGLLGFELAGGVEAGRAFIDALQMFYHVANIGDSRSLAIHPASTTHSQLSPAEQLATGVTPGYIRLSVGHRAHRRHHRRSVAGAGCGGQRAEGGGGVATLPTTPSSPRKRGTGQVGSPAYRGADRRGDAGDRLDHVRSRQVSMQVRCDRTCSSSAMAIRCVAMMHRRVVAQAFRTRQPSTAPTWSFAFSSHRNWLSVSPRSIWSSSLMPRPAFSPAVSPSPQLQRRAGTHDGSCPPLEIPRDCSSCPAASTADRRTPSSSRWAPARWNWAKGCRSRGSRRARVIAAVRQLVLNDQRPTVQFRTESNTEPSASINLILHRILARRVGRAAQTRVVCPQDRLHPIEHAVLQLVAVDDSAG